MKSMIYIIIFFFITSTLQAAGPDVLEILRRVDNTQNAERQILVTSISIHSLRGTRTIKFKSWTIGKVKSFTETLSPAREKGTKMLKLAKNLWIYYPRADRIIKIAGHMLRQSMMGSDFSYEDMMDKGKLLESYKASIVEDSILNDRQVKVISLTARTSDISYQKRKLWVDTERHIILKSELFAVGGKLLKRFETMEVFKTTRGWYPKKMLFKDVLKKGKGTEMIIHSVDFDTRIPSSKFSKSALRR